MMIEPIDEGRDAATPITPNEPMKASATMSAMPSSSSPTPA